MERSLKIGDLVWAKMKGFSPWPGRVASPAKDMKRPVSKKHSSFIYFFGTKNYAWIEDVNIKPYKPFRDQFVKTNKSAVFRDAVEEVEDLLRKMDSEGVDMDDPDAEFNRLRKSVNEQKKETKPKIRKDHPPKAATKRTNSESSSGPTTPSKRVRSNSLNEDQISGMNSITSTPAATHSPRRGVVSNLLDRPTSVARPETPPLDLEKVSNTLKEKNILPSSLKFGFLGLGIMGSGIVKNLLNSGHSVIVWNRTPEKVNDLTPKSLNLV
ncbi:hypothetical protein J437_LFUL011722 [Ladona fulva]|uniref:PWWP domain-containing protein n=1 Tax=Ladona fulva TaxID=123851 RepID=A0A8K0KBW4_LADFU|nr:hypothetical protein J437_LFUL011722 [Ladona fulva]